MIYIIQQDAQNYKRWIQQIGKAVFIGMEHRLVREPKAAPQRVSSALPVQAIVLK